MHFPAAAVRFAALARFMLRKEDAYEKTLSSCPDVHPAGTACGEKRGTEAGTAESGPKGENVAESAV